MKPNKTKIKHIKGTISSKNVRIGIVVAEFNEFFTAKLLEGTIDELLRYGVRESNISVFHVPGSFEIPFVVKRALKKRRFSAFISLGVIFKGETRHYSQVSDAAAKGTLKASLDSDIPVIHGVVTAKCKDHAVDRIGGKLGNRGRQYARSALMMSNLAEKI
jgi:6,7-dimethyl-8-ribityllumazine synthase